MLKKIFIFITIFLIHIVIFLLVFKIVSKELGKRNASVLNQQKPLEKYSIENLSKGEIRPGKIIIKNLIKEDKDYNSYLFEFEFYPDLSEISKKTTGQINIPKVVESSEPSIKSYPIILMARGYIDQKTYKTGDGTRNASAVLANNGFITIAPDFLGYGGSDKEAENIFETRFQTYVTALSLLKTLEQVHDKPNLISFDNSTTLPLINSILLWGHSNGGQVLLTILEISGSNYPTVLWAPVAKPFPYSILFYTDDSEDHGKFLRKELADFEENYDAEKYSLTNYLDKIKAPIFLQQGAVDESVPKMWSDNLAKQLKELETDLNYIVYPGTDHNMRPLWNEAILEDIEFYKLHI